MGGNISINIDGFGAIEDVLRMIIGNVLAQQGEIHLLSANMTEDEIGAFAYVHSLPFSTVFSAIDQYNHELALGDSNPDLENTTILEELLIHYRKAHSLMLEIQHKGNGDEDE